MYSKKVETVLKREKISVGDRITITRKGLKYEGILMPSTGEGDDIIIKLDSGYNVGFSMTGSVIKKISTGKPESPGAAKSTMKLNPSNPKIAIIATGGTIVSKVDYRTGGVHTSIDPKDLLKKIPELADHVNISSIKSPINRMSEDINPQDWIEITKAVHRELKNDIKGVVVTHGTDTMHYTSAALSFMIKNPGKPVVFTGAQKSGDRGSSDAWMNILCSAHAATGDIAEVGICMHGSINDDYCYFIRGTKARKMNTVSRDAFRPINDIPLSRIFPDGKTETLNTLFRKRGNEAELDARFEKKIALLKVYPGSDPSVMEYHMGKGVRGFVIEGTGLGHVPTFSSYSWIPQIRKALKDGIPVVMTSQAMYGNTNDRAYTNLRILRDAGAMSGQDMTSETALVKLGWVLGHTKEMGEIRNMMLTNISGEIIKGMGHDSFLY